MANSFFRFRHFTVFQDRCAFKVGTDSVLLGACADVSGARTVLDVGTGSGLLSLMIAQRSEACITAIEPDPESFCQASANISNSIWGSRIKLVNTDLQNFNLIKITLTLLLRILHGFQTR